MNKHRINITYLLLILLLTLFTSAATYAYEATSNLQYSELTTDISAISQEVDLNKYPDANAVLLDQATKIIYREDSTYTQWQEAYIKILTKKGREDYRNISSYYTVPYQNDEDCRIDLIEIIKPDGTVETIDIAKNSSISTENSSMSANIFNPNDKKISVYAKGLEVGDILHYKMYDNIVQPRARGIFTDIFSLEGINPIIHESICIEGPATFPLKKIEILDRLKDTVLATQGEKDGQIYYQWEIKNVPRAVPEPNMPALYTCTQRLLVSTAPDWESISRWYWNLAKPAISAVNPAIKKEVEQLTAEATTPQEKLTRIFKYVSQNIRYMGITTETVSPGYEPHPVSQTFQAKYGVCRDKAALLVAMLREAGIESYPVLIHSGDKKDIEVPNNYFNHAITAAKLDGKYILMDPTDENTQSFLPAYLNDKSYLVATPEGETLHTSEISPASKNLISIDTSGSLSKEGILTATSKIRFEGINDNAFRGYFARINPEERERLFESYISKVYGGGRVTECKILPKDLQDTSENMTVQIDYTTTNILAEDNGLALMPAPFLSKILGLVNNIFIDADLENRRFPFILNFTSGVKENVKISIEPGIKKIISLPVYSPVKSEQISWTRSLAQVKGNIIGSNSFLLNAIQFSPEEYSELKKALSAIEYNNRKMPVLAIAQTTPAVEQQVENYDVAVAQNINCKVLTENDWEVITETKKRILNYAGKKDNSEIIINYNPIWEDVAILSASVTSADGKMQTISPEEINLMDQSWNGQAPRYPGGKTLIASLPNVEIGSTIEYKIKYSYKNHPFFSMLELFGSFNPLTKSITIKGLDELNVQSMWNGPQTEYDRQKSIFSWSMSNTPIKRELFLPPSSSFLPTVAVSTGEWSKYNNAIRNAFTKASQEQEEAVALAQKLTGSVNDPIKKISIIRDYIYTNIKLVGPSFCELPLSIVSPADTTLKEGYGNTTDRAILFYTMLQAVGEKPEYYITTPYRAAEGLKTPILENPQNKLLQEVLVKLEHSGVPIWLNDTTEYAQLGTTPNVGNIALNLKNNRFEEIKVYESFMPRSNYFYSVDLNNNADAVIEVNKEFYGSLYEANHKMFSHMTPEEKKIFFQEELSTLSQAATACSELVIDFEAYPGKISYSAKIPKFGVRDNEYAYFDLPKTLGRIFNLRSDSRSNPLYIQDYIKTKINILIALPNAYRIPVILPKKIKWNSPMYNGKIETESIIITPLALKTGSINIPLSVMRNDLNQTLLDSRNALYITFDADIAPALYPSALYSQVLQIQNRLFSPSAKEIMLKDNNSATE